MWSQGGLSNVELGIRGVACGHFKTQFLAPPYFCTEAGSEQVEWEKAVNDASIVTFFVFFPSIRLKNGWMEWVVYWSAQIKSPYFISSSIGLIVCRRGEIWVKSG